MHFDLTAALAHLDYGMKRLQLALDGVAEEEAVWKRTSEGWSILDAVLSERTRCSRRM